MVVMRMYNSAKGKKHTRDEFKKHDPSITARMFCSLLNLLVSFKTYITIHGCFVFIMSDVGSRQAAVYALVAQVPFASMSFWYTCKHSTRRPLTKLLFALQNMASDLDEFLENTSLRCTSRNGNSLSLSIVSCTLRRWADACNRWSPNSC